ncbi:DUF6665 family protein [Roseibium marinum]|uniref:Uncharacterized protein n=1 Tax=Roseibium marinum TaxID=281252 RepID=A0A2S3UPZ1_9HYPH|nr:DUF6665 family protein [Roseibium marinum]POF29744.1 hypothetical protein CLV41_108169 [Roseibium marinum]
MAVRPPQVFSRNTEKDPLSAALEQEILGEKASTLSRLTGKLEKALSDLKTADGTPGLLPGERERLVALAGEALWHVIIQRELCGLRQHRAFNDFLGVPKEVRLRMGPARLSGKVSQ